MKTPVVVAAVRARDVEAERGRERREAESRVREAEASVSAQTVDEIVTRHVAARGGREALAAVRTLRPTLSWRR